MNEGAKYVVLVLAGAICESGGASCSITCAKVWPGDRKPVGAPDVAGPECGRMTSSLGDSWICTACAGDLIPWSTFGWSFPSMLLECEYAGYWGLVTAELAADLSTREATRGMGGS